MTLVDAFFLMVLMWVTTRITSKIFNRTLDSERVKILVDLDKERLIPLTVEVDGDQYLCYNSLTNDFVCQGANLNEIVDRFRARFPDKEAAITNGDAAVLTALKLQIKDLRENSSGIRSPS
jgi:hypothetical protein